MTANITLPSTAISQATAIEQSRAVAEVLAAVELARRFPRNEHAAKERMLDTCRIPSVAARAFYSFPRAGSRVTGPGIHLARELVRCWGNIQYSIIELSRASDRSEMMAYAWDLESNVRPSHTFIVPHQRDAGTSRKPLAELRDVYENNANNGARRVRECIFAVLPDWYVELAKATCAETNEHGGGEPLPLRISRMVGLYQTHGVSEDDLTRRLGRPIQRWTAHDVAQMGIVYQSMSRGETTREEEFPPPRLTPAEILAPPVAPAPPADEGWPEVAQPPAGEQ